MAILDSLINSYVNKPSLGKTNAVEEAYKYNWSVNNYFRIHQFNLKNPSFDVIENYQSSAFVTPTTVVLDALELSVKTITLTALETAPIDIWTGNTWQYTNGRAQMGQAQIELIDFSNGKLYKELTGILNINANEYPNNQEWHIQVLQHTEEYHQMKDLNVVSKASQKSEDGMLYLDARTAMLDSISELTYDKSNQDLMTFSITFKYYKRA